MLPLPHPAKQIITIILAVIFLLVERFGSPYVTTYELNERKQREATDPKAPAPEEGKAPRSFEDAGTSDSELLDWLEYMRTECNGHILSRCFMPSETTLRSQIREMMQQYPMATAAAETES